MAAKLSDLPQVSPTALTLRKQAFDSPDFLFELKHDGFRAMAYIAGGECRLVSRNKNVFRAFKRLGAELAAAVKVKNAILDGELVCLDSDGRSVFNLLMRRGSRPAFYAFDLLWLNDRDLRKLPLIERKHRLREIIPRGNPDVLFANHIEAKGKELFNMICAEDLEGIVAKRKDSKYLKRGWIKIKNPTYSQREGRKEMFDSFRK